MQKNTGKSNIEKEIRTLEFSVFKSLKDLLDPPIILLARSQFSCRDDVERLIPDSRPTDFDLCDSPELNKS